jgi:hypothetical protein
MPLPAGLWYCTIEKVMAGEYWTNRYVVSANTLQTAHGIGYQIFSLEQKIHASTVVFTKLRTSDDVPLTDNYQIQSLNYPGDLPATQPVVLPLFNCLRVDFTAMGGGRPSRKYLRGCLLEADIEHDKVLAARLTHAQTNFVNPMVALAGFVDVDAQTFLVGTAMAQVAMRQLRRGSKKKVTQ